MVTPSRLLLLFFKKRSGGAGAGPRKKPQVISGPVSRKKPQAMLNSTPRRKPLKNPVPNVKSAARRKNGERRSKSIQYFVNSVPYAPMYSTASRSTCISRA